MLRKYIQEILMQISFKQMDDDHKENTGMFINFNYGQFVLIRKYHIHMQYEILTYSATISQDRSHLMMVVYSRNM
jgi:hypothetical protein